MEHCTISLDNTARICVAALPIGVTPLVRIASHQFDDGSASSRRGCARHHLPECEHAR